MWYFQVYIWCRQTFICLEENSQKYQQKRCSSISGHRDSGCYTSTHGSGINAANTRLSVMIANSILYQILSFKYMSYSLAWTRVRPRVWEKRLSFVTKFTVPSLPSLPWYLCPSPLLLTRLPWVPQRAADAQPSSSTECRWVSDLISDLCEARTRMFEWWTCALEAGSSISSTCTSERWSCRMVTIRCSLFSTKQSFIPLFWNVRGGIGRLSHLLHNHGVMAAQLGKSDSRSNIWPALLMPVPANRNIAICVLTHSLLCSGECLKTHCKQLQRGSLSVTVWHLASVIVLSAAVWWNLFFNF